MRCEVVAVGTELLLGQVVDTNSSWIGEQLALAGVDCHHHVRVGDNPDRIKAILETALERSDAVIVCGGLGPTQDDITRDVIAEVMGVPLERDPEVEERIRAMFGSRGRDMPENNLRQSDVPRGARVMDQQPGTAPGLICPIEEPAAGGAAEPQEKVIYAVPGVPHEMQEMVAGSVIPDLRERSGETAVIRSRLAERLSDRIVELDELGTCTLAFLASGIEGLKVRITAKAADEESAEAVLAAEEAQLRGLLGDVVFGTDEETMESVVLELLRAQELTLGAAESLTGGLLAARLTAVAGASDVFRGSIVSYASEVKWALLGVPEGPVVTEAAAKAMAEGARRVLGADVGIGITGVAGPEQQEGRPVGTVCLGIADEGGAHSVEVQLPGDRHRVREFSVITVLDLLRRRLSARGA